MFNNSVKANARHILVEDGIIKDPDNLFEVVEKIRLILNEESLLQYGIRSKHEGLSVRTYLKVHNNSLIINVVNTASLSDKEQKRINERIEKSSHYDSIADFYIENPDPVAEGMGLGLSMIVVLLKSMNIDYKNFTISTDKKDKTFAKIVIPF